MKTLKIFYLANLFVITSCTEKTIGNEDITPEINKPQTLKTKTIPVDKNTLHVNLMDNEMPSFPAFPKLQKKPGKVLGYVKDSNGRPLSGATIGVRSSYLAGYYSGTNAVTDSKGYYEFSPAKGSSHFYNAGYQIQYANGLASVSLHPSDGALENWTTSDGMVENFVMLPYGITSKENVQNNPRLPSAFYGGAILLGWYGVEANDENAPYFAIKEGVIIEISLSPEGNIMDNTTKHSFIIRKVAGSYGELRIHNIPIGLYRISIKADGKAVKIRDNRHSSVAFGLQPSEAIGSAIISFMPNNADVKMIAPQTGAWEWVSLNLEGNN